MLKSIPGNAQHIGTRGEQQDSFGFSDPADKAFVAHGGLLGVVADGMGGLEGGRQASSAAVTAFLDAYARKTPQEPIPGALRRSLDAANAAVIAVAQQLGNEQGGTGTTLVAAVMHDRSLYWISVGDSRLYVLRSGRLVQVNADHNHGTALWAGVAAGRLDRQQALIDPQASHLTSYLGLPEIPLVDAALRAFSLEPGDVFLECTDGIYRSLSEDEIAEAFRSNATGPACEAIKAAALGKSLAQQDNLTVIAVQCADDSPPRSGTLPLPAGSNRLLITAVLGIELLFGTGLGGWYLSRYLNVGHSRSIQAHANAHTDHPSTPPPQHPSLTRSEQNNSPGKREIQ